MKPHKPKAMARAQSVARLDARANELHGDERSRHDMRLSWQDMRRIVFSIPENSRAARLIGDAACEDEFRRQLMRRA